MGIPTDPRQWRVGLVGYGEVGRILAEDLRSPGSRRLGVRPQARHRRGRALREHAEQNGVALAATHAALASPDGLHHLGRDGEPGRSRGRGVRARRSTRRVLPGFQLGVARRQDQGRGSIDAGGGRYVEAAVMTAIAHVPDPRAAASRRPVGGGAAAAARDAWVRCHGCL